MTRALALDDFSDHEGQDFAVNTPGGTQQWTLTEARASRVADAQAPRPPFALLFSGPADSAEDQGTISLAHPELGEVEIFIVPVDERDGRRYYEAVFA